MILLVVKNISQVVNDKAIYSNMLKAVILGIGDIIGDEPGWFAISP